MEPVEFACIYFSNRKQEAVMAISGPVARGAVMVPAPNPLTAIGGALRHAFALDACTRSLRMFEALLARLR
jgi:hypothetical protein